MADSAPHGHSGLKLGDFTTDLALLPVSGLAIVAGAVSAVVALALLRLIGLITNLCWHGRWDAHLAQPGPNHLGPWGVLVPVAGALAIGLMARFGSEKIRGHGIPEAIEAILLNGSRVEPRVALLKPLSSAISIGTGGPFGAEGPIIMTGGAFGSILAQCFHLTAAERKTLLVAGAAGGMSAVFATPIAATMLAVELLLFEWKPRSLIPVALASATAMALRHALLGPGPLFTTGLHPEFVGVLGLLGAVLVGLSVGALSSFLTLAVYAAEDAFTRLPIHWMWWPAIGAVVVGVGGLVFPPALGVGYDVIGTMLSGNATDQVLVGMLVVKTIVWVVALGSGTSGGVLAPLLLIGGALGGLEGHFLPAAGAGFWPMVAMAAIMGGTMRSPFTGVFFAVELTHDVNALLPLLVATVVAKGFTVLTMKRSILTEKLERRGHHLTREYAVDPLELVRVSAVMRAPTLPVASPLPVLVGPDDLAAPASAAEPPDGLGPTGRGVAHPDEPLRAVVYRMAELGERVFPVVDSQGRVVGEVALDDLLTARRRAWEEEVRRERVLGRR